MLQLGLVMAGFIAVVALMVYGSVTQSVTTKRALFWILLGSIALVSYFFR